LKDLLREIDRIAAPLFELVPWQVNSDQAAKEASFPSGCPIWFESPPALRTGAQRTILALP